MLPQLGGKRKGLLYFHFVNCLKSLSAECCHTAVSPSDLPAHRLLVARSAQEGGAEITAEAAQCRSALPGKRKRSTAVILIFSPSMIPKLHVMTFVTSATNTAVSQAQPYHFQSNAPPVLWAFLGH